MLTNKNTVFPSQGKALTIFFLAFFVLILFLQKTCFSLVTEKELNGTLLSTTVDGYSFWVQGPFVIRFMREGENAVPLQDSNLNGCPDFVENVALQLIAARHIFFDIAGFPDPLDSKFYPDAKKIYVLIASKKKLGGAHGLAFDKLSYFPNTNATKKNSPQPKVGGFAIRINNTIDPTLNRTPMHEYFHLIQNGMSHMKNAWYYEGMARWAEALLSPYKPKSGSKVLPKETIDLLKHNQKYTKTLLAQSYGAAHLLWIPLSVSCSKASPAFPEDDFLLKTTYLNDRPIIGKAELTGVILMRRVLELLRKNEQIPFSLYDYKEWSQRNRRRETNNKYIIDSVLQAYEEICPSVH